MSKSKEGVTAAIMAAIHQFEEEEALPVPVPKPHYAISFWKYSGLQEMMSMRMLWQLKMGKSAAAVALLARRRS